MTQVSFPAVLGPLPEERTSPYWVAKLFGTVEPGTDSTCSFSKNEPMCCYPLMCIQEGSDMGGRIRGLGTSESWFSLVYRAIVLFIP
jgi:hypothetical protein